MGNMDHQAVRNALCEIEDAARQLRNVREGDAVAILNMIARLTQIIREEIVK